VADWTFSGGDYAMPKIVISAPSTEFWMGILESLWNSGDS
jgi:hypothetical protein